MSFLDDVPKGNFVTNNAGKFISLLSDRVLVLPLDAPTKTEGGILLPDVAKERPRMGLVLLVGPGKTAELSGVHIRMTIKEGDYVYYPQYAGGEVYVDGRHYTKYGMTPGQQKVKLMNEHEIIGPIEPPADAITVLKKLKEEK